MSETVRVDLPVVRDDEGRVCCRNDRTEQCTAFSLNYGMYGKVAWCSLDGTPRCDDAELLVYRPATEKYPCSILSELRAEGRS